MYFQKKELIKVCGMKARKAVESLFMKGMKKNAGIDGILVTIGLCVIALLLCVVMRDSLTKFIETLVEALTNEAEKLLTGVNT